MADKATRYIGDARIVLYYVGTTADGRGDYEGVVHLPSGSKWKFSDLHSGAWGFPAHDSPEAFDKMADSAVGFGGYYTNFNRGEDVPDWAPSADLADEIEAATSWASDDQGTFEVRRRK